MPLKCFGQFLSDGRVEQDLVLQVFMGLHVPLYWFSKIVKVTAAILVYQSSLWQLNSFFCSKKLTNSLVSYVKTLYNEWSLLAFSVYFFKHCQVLNQKALTSGNEGPLINTLMDSLSNNDNNGREKILKTNFHSLNPHCYSVSDLPAC